ncbi:DUF4123 domain-containing protein [Marinobacter salinexigens]|uniref:DUF4123 domain-containing protein n=1 Tax=Marinobacter salinexigens TaxID=2919747 RepID=A0A5B0VAB2_9GAMM|nr:DUF4123 domain-containing protein [Marinobacter salinexigens]KAA1171123.1 DUF4123 domain-containing protein [Marinobacter salinexigens]
MVAVPQIRGKGETFILVDGAKVDALPQYIYREELSPECDALYRRTELESLVEISPWLVKAEFDGPISRKCFVDRMHDGVAIAVTSEAGFDALLEHFRSLLIAQTTTGEDAIFRFYDPEILRNLLSAGNLADDVRRLLGPCSSVAIQDRGNGHWEYFPNDAHPTSYQTALFVIREEHLVAMEQGAERTALRNLEAHTATYFPHLLSNGEDEQEAGGSAVARLIKAANGKGLWSTRDVALFINTIGWLGADAFEDAEVCNLWRSSSVQPGKAIAQIAEYAEKKSMEGLNHG